MFSYEDEAKEALFCVFGKARLPNKQAFPFIYIVLIYWHKNIGGSK